LLENSDILSKKSQIGLDKTNFLCYNVSITKTTCAFNQETKLIQCKSKTVALTGGRVETRDMTKTDAEQYNTDT